MNGQQKAEQNYQIFLGWKNNQTDHDFKQIIYRGQLSRTEIKAQCDFSDSVLKQNSKIKKELRLLEDNLRNREVLPQEVKKSSSKELPVHDTEKSKSRMNSARLSRLEQENAALLAENKEIKAKLKKYNLLEEIITESGRMPR